MDYNPTMQKIATRIFIAASIVFGVVGILYWATIPRVDAESSDLNHTMLIIMGATAAVILSSFAVSVAGKYLKDD